MEIVYKPHRYFFTIGKNIPRFTVGFIALCWTPALFLDISFIRVALLANLTLLFIALLFSMLLQELCGTTYTISDTSIVKKSPYKMALIHFANITRFHFVRIPLMKGYGLIKVPRGSLRLPFFIERLDVFIEDIQMRLAACGKQEIYDDRNIREFKLKAVINEATVRRMQWVIPKLFQIIIGSVVLGACIALVFWGMSLGRAIFWACMGLVFPIAGFLIAEALLNRRIAYRIIRKAFVLPKNRPAPEKLADLGFIPPMHEGDFDGLIDESKTYLIVGTITVVVYLLMGIIFKQSISFF